MNSSRYCDLEPGAAIFHELFDGVEGLKDRYFILITNSAPTFEAFTTTTQPYLEGLPKLATEFVEIQPGECCLPKHCCIDLRFVYEFDDIELGSKLRAKSVKHLGYLGGEVLVRLCDSITRSRGLSDVHKERFLEYLRPYL